MCLLERPTRSFSPAADRLSQYLSWKETSSSFRQKRGGPVQLPGPSTESEASTTTRASPNHSSHTALPGSAMLGQTTLEEPVLHPSNDPR